MNVEYVDHMGDDDSVVTAARVSFNRRAEEFTEDRNKRLIKYLAEHGHWTPFAAVQVQLRVKIPIFMARQYFKHIQGSVKNEVSRRYVTHVPEFWKPEEWRGKPTAGAKQGSSDPLSESEQKQAAQVYKNATAACEDVYANLLEIGVAPEQARAVLPQSMYTEFIDTASLVYWARMYRQRSDPHAQTEWKEITEHINRIMSTIAPYSWECLTNG